MLLHRLLRVRHHSFVSKIVIVRSYYASTSVKGVIGESRMRLHLDDIEYVFVSTSFVTHHQVGQSCVLSKSSLVLNLSVELLSVIIHVASPSTKTQSYVYSFKYFLLLCARDYHQINSDKLNRNHCHNSQEPFSIKRPLMVHWFCKIS